ncbi:MAG TPA: SDR family oxidoreductase [Streptosporangiaceae bacterium]
MSDPTTAAHSGQVVIVTGAGTGIGRAAALAFARAGAHVLGVGRRAEPLAAITNEHPDIVVQSADIRDHGAAEQIVDAALERWGRLDVLVNNAGVAAPMPLTDVTAERIGDLLATNVVAPSLLARAALAHLRATRGAIVNISSTYGQRPAAGAAHYAATKAALEQLTRSWALELAPDGVRVNAVAPGPTESDALVATGLPQTVIDQIKHDETERIPLGRRGEPAEVAAWILRLAAHDAAWLTGAVLNIDGGLALT